MTLTRETIRQGVLEVLRDKLHCPAELLAEENWDEPLTGRTFGLTAVDPDLFAFGDRESLGRPGSGGLLAGLWIQHAQQNH